MNIDVAFDFTSDTPNYWNNFWYDGVLDGGGADPDAVSKTLQTYHQFLWSKLLPNGEQMNLSMPNYQSFIEDFIHRTYTIGGSIIFPKGNSINRARGVNPFIKDRWDLTLECIRRYYKNDSSPLYETLVKNEEFFDLFIDFKGYVDFFYLQDCVSTDYQSVIFWIGDGDLSKNPMPKTVDEYLLWIEKQLDFVSKRNKRIELEIQL